MQVFKKMNGFSLYEISNDGTIRKVVTKEIISQRVHPGYGYKMCDLQDDDLKVHTVYPHKEVARAYIPTKKKGKLYVIHVNGNQQDNKVKNLQWVTPAEAQIHQLNMGFRKRLGNPELYKFSKYWKAKHDKKTKKGKEKEIKKDKQKVKGKKPKIVKGKLNRLENKGRKALLVKNIQPKKTVKSKAKSKGKKQVKKLEIKGRKALTAIKALPKKKITGKSVKKTLKGKVNKLESKNSKALNLKKDIKKKKANPKAKKIQSKKIKPSAINNPKTKIKSKANKNIALKKPSNINKAADLKNQLNKTEPKRGKRQRIKYRKIHSTKPK